MSWTFNATGSPEKIVEALNNHVAKMNPSPIDCSRVEFEDAKPAIIAAVSQNFVKVGYGYGPSILKVSAFGDGWRKPIPGKESEVPETIRRRFSLSIEQVENFVGL